MKNNIHLILAAFLIICSMSCKQAENAPQASMIQSPDGKIKVGFFLSSTGEAAYLIEFKDQLVIDSSFLGFDFKDAPSIKKSLKILGIENNTVNETWEMPWGEQREVVNHFKECTVHLQEKTAPGRLLDIIFRVFNDGVGFRYEFPEQENWQEAIILNENTQFQLTGDHQCWWIPGDWDIYEHLYNTTKFSKIEALSKRNHPNLAQTYIPENAVNTPVTMKTSDGLYLSFHEANLTDYAGMTLKTDGEKLSMQSNLVGSDRLGYKVKRKLPFHTPWRTIQVGEKAGDLIESNLIVNLNEPNKIGDVSWFEPTKYVGIWWEMHLGKSTWDYGMTQDMGTWTNAGNEHGKHGATTENTKKHIDFAAKNNIGAVLIEGWNTGWEHWIGFDDREGVFDFITPYPDYDLEGIVAYAKEKGVKIIMHHETSAAPRTYEQQLDTAFSLMNRLGIHAVKTGYVGKIIPEGEYHHGQWMVNHYRKVLETGVKYQVAINAHEPIKATGIRRTYPNAIAREGLRGQEFNAWASDGGNPPEHLSIVAFTRMLAGPIDFTPGIFNISLDPYKTENQINTTLAHQLALYVVINSPVQMAADLLEYYDKNDAFQFIREVGVNWETSKVLNGEIGDYVTIVRKERGSGNWFLGSITDENARTLPISFDFLDPNKKYRAMIYKDTKDAHWKDNPLAYALEYENIDHTTKMDLILAPGGGVAITMLPMDK